LEITESWVTDLSALRQLRELEEVVLLDCDNVDDITVLVDIPNLRTLRINGLAGRLGPDVDTFLAHLKNRGTEVEADDLDRGPMWDDDLEDDINLDPDDFDDPDTFENSDDIL
jgi:hypothetical protein